MKTFINKEENSVTKYDLENLTFNNESLKSKSELFRKLYDAGMEISEIAKECESHYSFVYGVISNSREIRKVQKESKSDKFRQMYADGMKVGEIAKQTNSNYSFVFGVIKKYKNEMQQAQ